VNFGKSRIVSKLKSTISNQHSEYQLLPLAEYSVIFGLGDGEIWDGMLTEMTLKQSREVVT